MVRIPLLLAATLALLPARALADHDVTVADGDTLSVIALMWYGDAGYAQTIADYNHLSDPDNLQPGQVLHLPEIPGTTTASAASPPGGTGAGPIGGGSAPARPPTSSTGPVIQMGLATWYGPGFDGQITKCGQTFHSTDMTASSNDLPCGTVIQVTDIDNGNKIVVTVDDTGGFQHPNILDLSPAAFDRLAPAADGVLDVSVARVLSVSGG